jgi:hypothetical protein
MVILGKTYWIAKMSRNEWFFSFFWEKVDGTWGCYDEFAPRDTKGIIIYKWECYRDCSNHLV